MIVIDELSRLDDIIELCFIFLKKQNEQHIETLEGVIDELISSN
jgi:hypothetical protein